MRPGDPSLIIDPNRLKRFVWQVVGKRVVLLAIVLVAWSASADAQSYSTRMVPLESSEAVHPLWTAAQVQRWAADRSPAARMLESERQAAAQGIERRDRRQCAQALLKQTFLSHLAEHERNRAAADALVTYARIVGLTQQRLMLDEALVVLQRLIALADQTESLGLSDQDPNDLRRQREVTADQRLQLDSGVEKLRMQLAQLTGQTLEITQQAILIDPLWLTGTIPDTDEAITVALGNRADLRAVQTIGRRLNEDTLATARTLLASQQPGLGMAPPVIRRFFFACLSKTDLSSQDLGLRRQQADRLSAARSEQIEWEVRSGVVDLATARRREELANERSLLAAESVVKLQTAIELDQAVAGSDLLAKLDMLTEQGASSQHLTDQAVAWVRLWQSQGLAANSLSIQSSTNAEKNGGF